MAYLRGKEVGHGGQVVRRPGGSGVLTLEASPLRREGNQVGMARGYVSGHHQSCFNNCQLLSQGGANKYGRTDISSTDYSQIMINHARELLPSFYRTEIRVTILPRGMQRHSHWALKVKRNV